MAPLPFIVQFVFMVLFPITEKTVQKAYGFVRRYTAATEVIPEHIDLNGSLQAR